MKTIGLEHAIPIFTGEENQYVTFMKVSSTDEEAYLEVPDKQLQKAIESSHLFKDGIVKLFASTDDGKLKGISEEKDVIEYPDVTDFQTAKEVLKKEYGVAPQALGSPEKIFAQADKVGASFPNLKEDE